MRRFYPVFALLALFVGFAAKAQSFANPAPVDLGTAGNFTILAKSGISDGGGIVNGNIGVSPIDQTGLTGFSETLDASTQFSTSIYVVGKLYAADYGAPTPTIMTAAISDMETAYTNAAGRAADVTGLGGGTIGVPEGALISGVYQWGTDLNITTNLTLSGSASDIWIFQVAQNLILSSGVNILLVGGAQAKNIYWQVAGQATLASTVVFNGNILCATAIVFNDATLNGKALAQTAVTIGAGTATSTASGFGGANPPGPGKAFAYPSPAKGSVVNVVYNMLESGEAQIRVYNEIGDLAAEQKEQKLSGPQKTQISVRNFAPGVYLYKVVLAYASGKNENLNVQKFVVLK
jgi:hypothetical protein